MKTKTLSVSKIKALSPADRRRLFLPQEPKPATLTLHGKSVNEAMMLIADPNAWQKDVLLLRAKRAVKFAGASTANFSNSELRSISWFAHLPELSGSHLSQSKLELMKENEEHLFWEAYKRQPEMALTLVKQIRESGIQKDVENVLLNPKKFSSSKSGSLKKATQRARKQIRPEETVRKFADKFAGRSQAARTK